MVPKNEQMKLIGKFEEITKDKDTSQWINGRTSDSLKVSYPRHLARFLIIRNLTIQEWIEAFKRNPLEETKEAENIRNDLKAKYSPGTIAMMLSAVASRLEYDGLAFARRIKVVDATDHPTIANEVVPTKQQILDIINTVSLRAKVIITLIAFTGMRFKAISGLTIGNLPELRIYNQTVEFENIPSIVRITKELSKNKLPYITFLIERACKILKQWLEFRMRQGESLDQKSYIVPVEAYKNSNPEKLSKRAAALARVVANAVEPLGYNQRPYSFKDYFATQLLNSGILDRYQEFFLGHKGPMQLTYSLRRQLPLEQIEEMRKLFKEKIAPNLVPSEVESLANQSLQKQIEELIKDKNETLDIYKLDHELYIREKLLTIKLLEGKIIKKEYDDSVDRLLRENHEKKRKYLTFLPDYDTYINQIRQGLERLGKED